MSTKKSKRRTKSQNETGSLWEEFQLNSTNIPNGNSVQKSRTQSETEASSLWEQFQLNNTQTNKDDMPQTENIEKQMNTHRLSNTEK